MMNLNNVIDFILSNLVFVLLIIGGIFSSFKRMTEGGQNQEQPPKRMERSPAPVRPSEAHTRKVERKPVHEHKDVWGNETGQQHPFEQHVRKEKRSPQQEQYQTIRQDTDLHPDPKVEEDVPRVEKSIKRGKKGSPSPVSVQLFTKGKLNRNDVMKGVIWSEVLGPPRAKKPYRK